ncbi:hypothetical protein HBB16_05375 [Pseudonocardia sp. MCCB 268]|nr:hypothetical protein [Pseudonocardia cytotoxica]
MVDGVALTALGDRGESHLAAAGPAAWIAELQLTTGTGPCWEVDDSHRLRSGWARPDSPTAHARWPGFAAAVEHGYGRVRVPAAGLARPAAAPRCCVGIAPGPLTAEQLRTGWFARGRAGDPVSTWARRDPRRTARRSVRPGTGSGLSGQRHDRRPDRCRRRCRSWLGCGPMPGPPDRSPGRDRRRCPGPPPVVRTRVGLS